MNISRCFLPALLCASIAVPATAQYPIAWSAYKDLAQSSVEEPNRILNAPGGGYYVDAAIGGGHVLFKLDASGAKLWSRGVPGSVGDMAVGASGVALAGSASSAPGNRLCVAKFDGSGNQLWFKTLPGGLNMQQVRTALDPAGNVIVSAYLIGVSSQGDYDGRLLKLDGQTGATVFDVQTATADVREQFMKVGTDSSGSIYVVGKGTVGNWLLRKYTPAGTPSWEDKGAGYDPDFQVDGSGNSFLVNGSTFTTGVDVTKFNNLGQYVWGTTVEGIQSNPIIALAPSGKVVVVGRTGTGLTLGRVDSTGFQSPPTSLAGFAPANVGKGWVSVDNADNVYVASFSAAMGQPAALHKFDANGVFQWSRIETATQTSSFDSRSVVVDPAGRAMFLTRYPNPAPTYSDARVTAFDGAGNTVWTTDNDFGKSSDSPVQAVTESSGTTYMIGSSSSPTSALTPQYSLARFSSTGGVSWSRKLPMLAGSALGTVGPLLVPGGAVAIVRTRTNNAGLSVVQRYDAAGNLTWKYDSFPGSQFVMDAKAGADGSVYLAMAAWAPNGTGGNPSFLRVIKLNSAGGLVWTADKAGGTTDWPYQIAVDGSGNAYLSYSFQDSATGSTIPAIAKVNANGSFAWSKPQGAFNSSSWVGTVQVDPSGNAFAYGTVADPNNVNLSIDQLTKYDPAGNVLWSVVPLAGTGARNIERLSIDALGNAFVQGQLLVNDQPTTRIERISPAGVVAWDADFISNGSGPRCALVPDQLGGVSVVTMVYVSRGLDYQLVKVNASGALAFPSSGGVFSNGAALYDNQLLDDRPQTLSGDGAGNLYVGGTSYGSSGTIDLNLVKFAANESQFVSQSVPAAMTAGQTYAVTVTFKNTGFETWTKAAGYKLSVLNGATWGLNTVFLNSADAIQPGQSRTFTFSVFAPTTAGTFNLQSKLYKNSASFGSLSAVVPVTTTVRQHAARFVTQTVPTTVKAGSTFSVTVDMRNVGTNTWTQAGGYGLVPASGYPTWGLAKVLLAPADSILQGADKVFTFNCLAPSTPGTYTMRWQMNRTSVGAFGDKTVTKTITVTP